MHGSCRTEHMVTQVTQGLREAAAGWSGAWDLQNRAHGYPGNPGTKRGSSRQVRCMGPAEQSTWLPRGEERQQQAGQVHRPCRIEHVVIQGLREAAAGWSGAWDLQNRARGYPGMRRGSSRQVRCIGPAE